MIACADSEADDPAADGAGAALRNGSPLLLACLLDRVIRIGPLVELQPGVHRRGFAQNAAPTEQPPGEAQPRIELLACLGALLVGAQTLNYRLGARRHCLVDRVVELNPWAIESTGYRHSKSGINGRDLLPCASFFGYQRTFAPAVATHHFSHKQFP